MPIQGPIPFPPKKRRRTRPRWPLWTGLAAFGLGLGLLGWIAADWSLLKQDVPDARARWAVTLAGEGAEADRIGTGLALLAQGRADSLVLSGTPIVGTVHTSTVLLSSLAPETGLRRRVLEARHSSHSTVDEAQALIPLLRERGADTVLLITSDYHSRRAASILNHLAPRGMVFLPVAAPNPSFSKGWSSREGAKLWLLEWSKTLWWHLIDRWSPGSPRPGAAVLVRFPDAGHLGEACPACPAPLTCPAPPPCPEAKAAAVPERRAEKPKEKSAAKEPAKAKPKKDAKESKPKEKKGKH